MTLGDLSMHMRHPRLAAECYALVLGVRGLHWRVCLASAGALAALAHNASQDKTLYVVWARAAGACAIQSCTISQRSFVVQTLQTMDAIQADIPLDTPPTICGDHLAPSVLSVAAAAALQTTLRKRGGANVLAERFTQYMSMIQDGTHDLSATCWTVDDDTSAGALRSVRTL